MSNLAHLSDKELDNLIDRHQQMQSKSEEKDYSHQYERNWLDPLRDITYGGLHSSLAGAEMLGNIVTGGHLHDIPYYGTHYLPWLEKNVNAIKSPHPSPGGDLLKVIGELGIPETIGANLGKKALIKVLEKSPLAFTEKGATKGLKRIGEQASEIGGHAISPEVSAKLREIFTEHAPLRSAKSHVEDLLSQEGYEPAFKLQSFLDKMNRRLNKFTSPVESQVAGDVVNLNRQKVIDDVSKYLEERVKPELGSELRHEQKRYKNYMKIKKGVYEPAKKVVAPLGVGYEVMHKLIKLLGG